MSEPTVHVVDDDGSFLLSMSRWLRASGLAVKTYMSASDFLARQDAGMPGCVIADLQVPDVRGLAVGHESIFGPWAPRRLL